MSEVIVTVELDDEVYTALLVAANEMGVTPADLAGAIVENYVKENYAEV